MTWVTVFGWLVKLATGLIEYYSNKRLLEAGQAEAVAAIMRDANASIAKALAASRAVTTSLPGDNERDPYLRD